MPARQPAPAAPPVSEPAQVVGVGAMRLVRTVRIGQDGGLYPVNSAAVWADGWNEAVCGRGGTTSRRPGRWSR